MRQRSATYLPELKVMACLYEFVCLAMCQEDLGKEKRERVQMEREKDATIDDLQHKLDNMETDYEKVLHVSKESSEEAAANKTL